MCYFLSWSLFIHDVGFPWFLLVFYCAHFSELRCFSRLRFYSLFRVEAEHIMAFTFVCFSELSFGACPSAVTSLVACFCSSLLSSVIYLGHCSHSLIQRPTSAAPTWRKPSYPIVTACLKMCKRFLAAQPVTIQLISLLFSSVPSSLSPGTHHLWKEACFLSLSLLLQYHPS